MSNLSPVAKALVLDALAHHRPHVQAYGGMSAMLVKGAKTPAIEPALFAVMPDDAEHMLIGINRLHAEINEVESMIINLRIDQINQQDVADLNADLIERLTMLRRRALLTARARGRRKSATVADLDAAVVINRLQNQINEQRSGFEVIRATLDAVNAPTAIGLHKRIEAQAKELASWKKRALMAEAYERNRTRNIAQTEQRARA